MSDAEWLKKMNLDQLKGPGAWDSYDEPVSSSRADRKSASENEET
jgi:hypothetical protein